MEEEEKVSGENKVWEPLLRLDATQFKQKKLSNLLAKLDTTTLFLRFGPLPERVLALYTHQILAGVAYLHLNKVIHRDLKGNNVMLMPTGVIKLIDFGCARRLSCPNHTSSNSGDVIKSVHGTPYWMAPEVHTGLFHPLRILPTGCQLFTFVYPT